ncbi:DUF1275 family protein [Cupriavidus necator]|uniref:DUF1275 family protein n=1 Tax=Cupriavidus necator TaxID=106590 RepID=UPI0023EBA16C|nr:DUF1275 family protein [Cupriavidus necator]
MITKLSNAEIRTTHLTGMVTDIGIELGKLCYWNAAAPARTPSSTQARPCPACSPTGASCACWWCWSRCSLPAASPARWGSSTWVSAPRCRWPCCCWR